MCPIYFLKVLDLLIIILDWQFSDKSAYNENISYHLRFIKAGKVRLRQRRIRVNPDLDLAIQVNPNHLAANSGESISFGERDERVNYILFVNPPLLQVVYIRLVPGLVRVDVIVVLRYMWIKHNPADVWVRFLHAVL